MTAVIKPTAQRPVNVSLPDQISNGLLTQINFQCKIASGKQRQSRMHLWTGALTVQELPGSNIEVRQTNPLLLKLL